MTQSSVWQDLFGCNCSVGKLSDIQRMSEVLITHYSHPANPIILSIDPTSLTILMTHTRPTWNALSDHRPSQKKLITTHSNTSWPQYQHNDAPTKLSIL